MKGVVESDEGESAEAPVPLWRWLLTLWFYGSLVAGVVVVAVYSTANGLTEPASLGLLFGWIFLCVYVCKGFIWLGERLCGG